MSSKFFWRSAERMIGQWHICDWCDATNQPINEGNREATIGDAVDYLGYDHMSGEIKQFLRPYGRVRITDKVIVPSHLQLNVACEVPQAGRACLISMDALATFPGDFPYGVVRIQGFVVEKLGPGPNPQHIYTQ